MGQPPLKNEKYTIEEWQELEQSGEIESLDFSLPLEKLYRGVVLSPEEKSS